MLNKIMMTGRLTSEPALTTDNGNHTRAFRRFPYVTDLLIPAGRFAASCTPPQLHSMISYLTVSFLISTSTV